MLAENNFYIIQSFADEDGIVKATIEINASHKIFEGHFPGQPVVPGVCMMQIVKELLEKAILKETRLSKADHIKFLSVINPLENNIAQVELKYLITGDEINLTATITNSTATCFKMKATFKQV